MQHFHLEKCKSSQDYLKNILSEKNQADQNILVSSNLQSQARGRSGNKWFIPENALTFSFSLKANPILTLTSLEIGLLLSNFFNQNLEDKDHVSFLKWPNDLLTRSKQKFAGIICQVFEDNTIIAGIGINYGQAAFPENNFKTTPTCLFPDKIINSDDRKKIIAEIYDYVLKHRLSSNEIIDGWKKNCIHMNQQIKIDGNTISHAGKFIGIGPRGEALIENNGNIKQIVSGSLFFN